MGTKILSSGAILSQTVTRSHCFPAGCMRIRSSAMVTDLRTAWETHETFQREKKGREKERKKDRDKERKEDRNEERKREQNKK